MVGTQTFKASINAACNNLGFARKMSTQETLGFENLGLERVKLQRRRKGNLAKRAVVDQEAISQKRSLEQAWCPPGMPAHQTLPISLLGNSANSTNYQEKETVRKDFTSLQNALTVPSYQSRPDCVPSSSSGVSVYQSGQGFTPINRSPPLNLCVVTQSSQTILRHGWQSPVAPATSKSTTEKTTMSV